MSRPIIGITMGEPAGIGPEICVKALSVERIYKICRPFLYGDKSVLEQIFDVSKGIKNKTRCFIQSYNSIADIKFKFGEIAVIDFGNIDMSKLRFSCNSKMGGRASGEYIKRSIEDAMNGKIAAVVTAPISKVSFKLGGWGLRYAGHTEMFADLTKTKDYAMLLCHGNFRVLHATTHIPLKDVPTHITKDRLVKVIDLSIEVCTVLGIKNPRIGVCGLNPHSGEGGKIGKEEITEITPAIEISRKLNEECKIDGPLPPDTAWSKVLGGVYDIGVAMYHDQGHIPTKLLGFSYNKDGSFNQIKGINLTVGIPIIRVSVDHGVAYGKAGKGVASADSLLEAIEMAVTIAKNKEVSKSRAKNTGGFKVRPVRNQDRTKGK